jgi:hypothetical protein
MSHALRLLSSYAIYAYLDAGMLYMLVLTLVLLYMLCHILLHVTSHAIVLLYVLVLYMCVRTLACLY